MNERIVKGIDEERRGRIDQRRIEEKGKMGRRIGKGRERNDRSEDGRV